MKSDPFNSLLPALPVIDGDTVDTTLGRKMLSNMDVHGFQTKIVDGQMVRTKGGMPEITRESAPTERSAAITLTETNWSDRTHYGPVVVNDCLASGVIGVFFYPTESMKFLDQDNAVVRVNFTRPT